MSNVEGNELNTKWFLLHIQNEAKSKKAGRMSILVITISMCRLQKTEILWGVAAAMLDRYATRIQDCFESFNRDSMFYIS